MSGHEQKKQYLNNLSVSQDISHKGKDSNFIIQKPGRQHLNKVIKVNIASHKAY